MVWDLSILSEWFSPGRCVWSSFSIGPTPRRHPRPHTTTMRSITHHNTHVPRPGPAGENPAPLANHLQVTSGNPNRTRSKPHQQTFQEQIPGQHSRGQDQGCLPMVSPMDPTYGHGPPSRGGDSRIFLWEYRTDIDYQHVTSIKLRS